MSKSESLGKVYETDVLVVGGGLAGVNAAIAAAERGAKVLILDKGGIERSGSITSPPTWRLAGRGIPVNPTCSTQGE